MMYIKVFRFCFVFCFVLLLYFLLSYVNTVAYGLCVCVYQFATYPYVVRAFLYETIVFKRKLNKGKLYAIISERHIFIRKNDSLQDKDKSFN